MVKKKVKKRSKKTNAMGAKSVDKKFNLVLGNLLTFVVLLVASVLLYYVSNNNLASDIFYMLAILFGVISVAFLISFLVFVFLKITKK